MPPPSASPAQGTYFPASPSAAARPAPRLVGAWCALIATSGPGRRLHSLEYTMVSSDLALIDRIAVGHITLARTPSIRRIARTQAVPYPRAARAEADPARMGAKDEHAPSL